MENQIERTQKFRVVLLKSEQKMGMNLPQRLFAQDLSFSLYRHQMY